MLTCFAPRSRHADSIVDISRGPNTLSSPPHPPVALLALGIHERGRCRPPDSDQRRNPPPDHRPLTSFCLPFSPLSSWPCRDIFSPHRPAAPRQDGTLFELSLTFIATPAGIPPDLVVSWAGLHRHISPCCGYEVGCVPLSLVPLPPPADTPNQEPPRTQRLCETRRLSYAGPPRLTSGW